MANQLRPMGIGDILDTAFSLYKRRFVPFLTISMIVYVPYAILMALIGAFARSISHGAARGPNLWDGTDSGAVTQALLLQTGAPDFSSIPVFRMLAMGLVAFVGFMVFLSIVYPLCAGALMVNISELYLGRELTALESYKRVFGKLGRLLYAHFLAMLCIGLGMVLCVVPGILCSLWFMLVTAVVLMEDHGASASLKRSRTLMSGNLGKGFLLGLAVAILGAVVSFGVGFVVRLVPWPAPFVADFLGNLAPAFVLPLSIGATVLLYYDLRIRKEGFDLEYLAAGLNASRSR
ncbi:MAG TPA: hypothetical protein VHE30_08140 [Polyangiaceae bacterium]|nr:hypothetical protein [Polyangiaceae bacterium]